MTKALRLVAGVNDDGRRLDRILRKALPDMPLSALHSLLRKGRVLVDGVPGKAAGRVRAGAVIRLPVEDGGALPSEKRGTLNSASGLDARGLSILWESADLLVVNKPAGVAVHGPDRASGDSLETLVRAYLAPKLPPSLAFRSGPLHRLDRATSGIILFSKSLEGARSFSALLRERRVRKTYLALLEGRLRRDETWEDVLTRDREQGKSFAEAGGIPARGESREARTRVQPLARSAGTPGFTLARVELDTGRTHQIRVQAAARAHPLAGDRKYGGTPQRGGFLLHAHTLELPGRTLPGLPRRLEAPLPERFRRRIEELFGAALARSL